MASTPYQYCFSLLIWRPRRSELIPCTTDVLTHLERFRSPSRKWTEPVSGAQISDCFPDPSRPFKRISSAVISTGRMSNENNYVTKRFFLVFLIHSCVDIRDFGLRMKLR